MAGIDAIFNPMSPIAIGLIVVSAFLHAAWNFHGKSRNPSAAFFLVATAFGALCLAPILLFFLEELATIPVKVWCLLVLTGFFLAVYYTGLATAYRIGDMSLAYPLARSMPVVFATVVTLAFSLGGRIGPMAMAGFLLVVVGCLTLPMKRLGALRLKDYLNGCCLLALLAAAGTAGYSITDDHALRLLRDLPEQPLTEVTAPLMYILLEGLISSIWLAIFLVGFRNQRRQIADVMRHSKASAVLMGLMIWTSYALVLAAMAFASNVSYIVAFRQLSIPIGAMLGIVLLKEPCPKPKVIGLSLMLIGLVLVATG